MLSPLLGILLLSAPAAPSAQSEPSAPPTPEQLEFFERQIRPVLVEHCHGCHGPRKQQAGLRLDSAAALHAGADTGPVIVPGKPEESSLIAAVRGDGATKMPPKTKLPPEAIQALEEWVRQGAFWPAAAPSPASADAWRQHWAFQPLQRPAVPPGGPTAIDAFLERELAKQQLSFAVSADRWTLLRRVSFALHGLPPSHAEVQAYCADPTADDDAWARVVDRLLAAPAFGERWGRYWLDHARYADEKGYIGVGVDRSYPFAWTYRDWVIQAFNADYPHDEFVRLQLAADQMVRKDNHHDLAALGFLTVGRRFINNIHDIIDDRLDTTFRTTLGLSVSCARCHDHKYDPIPITDYYGLYGVFASTQEPDVGELPLLGEAEEGPAQAEFHAELARRQAALAQFEAEHAADKREAPWKFFEQIKPFQNRIRELHARHPGAPPRAMVLLDQPEPITPQVFLRGNPAQPGPRVSRQFLAFLAGPQRQPFRQGSGRWELAQALTAPSNPLFARVAVNRVWMRLFGQGLVRTPSDFGLRGEPPTHPDLLDYLADEFQRDGYSIKRLIRRILLSQAYRQTSIPSPRARQHDPENRWLSHAPRLRLDLEAWRDSMLLVSGRLDPRRGGPPVELFSAPFPPRRTIYGKIERQNLAGVLRTFDFAIPDQHSPQRHVTTVPQQALFFLNSPFVQELAGRLIQRPEVQAATDLHERVQVLYRLCFARDATSAEVADAVDYLGARPTEPAWTRYAHALLMSNEFLFVD